MLADDQFDDRKKSHNKPKLLRNTFSISWF